MPTRCSGLPIRWSATAAAELRPEVRQPLFEQWRESPAGDGLMQPSINEGFSQVVARQQIEQFFRRQRAQCRFEFLLQARFDGVGNHQVGLAGDDLIENRYIVRTDRN